VRPLLGGGAAEDRPEVFVTEYERRAARERLGVAGLDPAQPFVAVHPGASWRPRAWRPERFAELAARVSARQGLGVVFLGDSSERDIEAAIKARLGTGGAVPGARYAFCFGTLSLREACAVLAEARLAIGNDSGFAHIAAACGTPVVALFGPQLPGRFRPWSPRAEVLHHRIDCCPCAQRVCVRPEEPCVNLITVDEADSAATRLLKATRA
jgi:ADP-heptose:LPS heptosyltransferase